MRKWIFALLLGLCVHAAQAAGPVGTLGFDFVTGQNGFKSLSSSGMILLVASVSTQNNVTTFRKIDGAGLSTGYQVTSGKTMRCPWIDTVASSATGMGFTLQSQANDSQWNGTTAGTTPLYFTGQTASVMFTSSSTAGNASRVGFPLGDWSVGAGRYVGVVSNTSSNASFWLYCYETTN